MHRLANIRFVTNGRTDKREYHAKCESSGLGLTAPYQQFTLSSRPVLMPFKTTFSLRGFALREVLFLVFGCLGLDAGGLVVENLYNPLMLIKRLGTKMEDWGGNWYFIGKDPS